MFRAHIAEDGDLDDYSPVAPNDGGGVFGGTVESSGQGFRHPGAARDWVFRNINAKFPISCAQDPTRSPDPENAPWGCDDVVKHSSHMTVIPFSQERVYSHNTGGFGGDDLPLADVCVEYRRRAGDGLPVLHEEDVRYHRYDILTASTIILSSERPVVEFDAWGPALDPSLPCWLAVTVVNIPPGTSDFDIAYNRYEYTIPFEKRFLNKTAVAARERTRFRTSLKPYLDEAERLYKTTGSIDWLAHRHHVAVSVIFDSNAIDDDQFYFSGAEYARKELHLDNFRMTGPALDASMYTVFDHHASGRQVRAPPPSDAPLFRATIGLSVCFLLIFAGLGYVLYGRHQSRQANNDADVLADDDDDDDDDDDAGSSSTRRSPAVITAELATAAWSIVAVILSGLNVASVNDFRGTLSSMTDQQFGILMERTKSEFESLGNAIDFRGLRLGFGIPPHARPFVAAMFAETFCPSFENIKCADFAALDDDTYLTALEYSNVTADRVTNVLLASSTFSIIVSVVLLFLSLDLVLRCAASRRRRLEKMILILELGTLAVSIALTIATLAVAAVEPYRADPAAMMMAIRFENVETDVRGRLIDYDVDIAFFVARIDDAFVQPLAEMRMRGLRSDDPIGLDLGQLGRVEHCYASSERREFDDVVSAGPLSRLGTRSVCTFAETYEQPSPECSSVVCDGQVVLYYASELEAWKTYVTSQVLDENIATDVLITCVDVIALWLAYVLWRGAGDADADKEDGDDRESAQDDQALENAKQDDPAAEEDTVVLV